MKKSRSLLLVLVGQLLMSLCWLGCGKSAANSQAAMDPAKIADAVGKAFANAADADRQAAAGCVTAIQNQDSVVAFDTLRQMSQEPQLTPAQRQLVAKSMQAMFLKMQTAAQTGDVQAQAAMHNYLSTR